MILKSIWDFWFYEGEESGRSNQPTQIVLDFMKQITSIYGQKLHIVVADSYYGSYELAIELNTQNFGCFLSCRSDRPSKLFSQHLHKELIKREWNCINNSQFSAITYYDKRKVNLISILVTLSKQFQISTTEKKLSFAIYWHRKRLGSVDHFDRWMHLYLSSHRNIK